MSDTRDIVERPESPFNRPPLAERIAQAKAHMAGYRQHNEALWPHQSFALTVGELLEAAERGLKAAAEIKQLRADLATSMETAAKGIAALSKAVNERAAATVVPLYKVRVTGRLHETEPLAAAFELRDGEHVLYAAPHPAQTEGRDGA